MLYPVWVLENQFQNKNGSNLVNGKVYVYHQGRSSLANIFQDEDGNFAQSNPVTLDANARGVAYADSSFVYTIVVCDFYNKELFSYDTRIGGAGGTSGSKIVIHDATLSGYGTTYSPLGAVTMPLAVDETMTAYTANVGGKESLVLGVEGDWFNNTFNSALSSKVDLSAFEECCASVKGSLSGKADLSILENYYNKNEINSALSNTVTYEFLNDNVYKKYQTSSKEELASAFASAGQGGEGGNCPWISGTKVIADTQTLTSNMILQVLSSFTMSGDHNHFIGMKGGTYRFPNEYEIGSALLHTNYFMHLSAMSGYLPQSAFSSYTASIANNLESNWNYTNSAYSLSLNNFYNKLDVSAFSAYSAGQDTIINNITDQITNISNASGGWNDKLDSSAFENASGNFYPMTGNPSGFLTEHQSLEDYYKKTETSSKEEISAAIANVPQGDPEVNNVVHNYSANGTWLTAHQDISNLATKNEVSAYILKSESGVFQPSGNYLSSNALNGYATQQWVENQGYLTAHQDISNLMPKSESANFYPMNSNPSGYLTSHQDLSDYATTAQVDEVSSLLSAGLDYVSANAGGLTGSYVPTSAIGYSMIIEDAGRMHPTSISGSSIWAPSAGIAKEAFIAFSANRAQMDKDGCWIDSTYVKNSAFNNSASYWNEAINYISSVTTPTTDRTFLSAAIDYVSGGVDYVSANAGKTYTGVAPINVNNSTNEISISGESLSAGPNIDLFESGGYVVISANGGGSNFAGIGEYYIDNDSIEKKLSGFGLYEQANNRGSYQVIGSANDGTWHGYGYTMSLPEGVLLNDINTSASNYALSAVSSLVKPMVYADITFSAVRNTIFAGGIVIPYEVNQGYSTVYEYVGSSVNNSYSSFNFHNLQFNGYGTTLTISSYNDGATTGKLKTSNRYFASPSDVAAVDRIVLVSTSGDIPASGSSDDKVYIVTGTN